MNQKKARLFTNTQEAVAFGEKASLDEMSDLLKKVSNIMISKMADISFELQVYREAHHAFLRDDWYESYCRRGR